VGTLLKELYVDSALRKAEKLNKEHESNEPSAKMQTPVEINWKQYKSLKRS